MSRKVWAVFVLVQLFGELGPWAGLHMKSAIGPVLWFAGIVVMMPGRVLALWLEQVFWGVRLTPVQTTVVFVVVEVAANLLFWAGGPGLRMRTQPPPAGAPNGTVPFNVHYNGSGPLRGVTSVDAGGTVKTRLGKVGVNGYVNVGTYTPNISDEQNCPD